MASIDVEVKAPSSQSSLVDISSSKFSKKEKNPTKIKVKKKKDNDDHKKVDSPGSDSPGPIVNQLDEKDAVTFPSGNPLEDNPDSVICKHCKKPVLKDVAPSHLKECLKQKQERAKKRKEAKEAKEAAAREKENKEKEKEKEKDKDGDTKMEDPKASSKDQGEGSGEKVKTAKKSATKEIAEDGKKSKKRKAEGDGAEKAPKAKKKKDEPKPKVPKPKGPVDVEKQCGVPLPNGAQCARSLTCKSHSMGAKRAVPGRSLPYDMLLQAYQKKNQAKQQKAAIDANAPLADDSDTNAGPVDSDEEKDAVMAGLARSRPQPIEHHVFVPTRRKYQYIRMKEMLSNALGGSRGGGLFSLGDAAGQNWPPGQGGLAGDLFSSPVSSSTPDALGIHSRRPSLMQQAIAGQQRSTQPGTQVSHSRKSSTSVPA